MNAIVCEQLEFGWHAWAPVLRIPELLVRDGERVLLQGASGSGKSTLLGLIGGVFDGHKGRLQVLGQELGSLGRAHRDRFRAEQIGFVFQTFNLIPYLSVIENILLAGVFSKVRLQRAQKAGSHEAEARRLLAALGLDAEAVLDQPASCLSQGQQQRVATARALFGRPRLLIADEPTSSLDVGARDQFLALLLAECAESAATVLVVSHDPGLAPWFDRCLTMQEINRV